MTKIRQTFASWQFWSVLFACLGVVFAFKFQQDGLADKAIRVNPTNVHAEFHETREPAVFERIPIERISVGQYVQVMAHLPDLADRSKTALTPNDKLSHLSLNANDSVVSIELAPDLVLPQGAILEVSEGVIRQFKVGGLDQPHHELVGTRYVVGDVDATDFSPLLWRVLDLELEKPDGSIAKVNVGRPLWWVAKTNAQVGGTVNIGLHEVGVSGFARIQRIYAFPLVSPPPLSACLVTGKIEHKNAIVWDLVFDNGDSLGITANHPIFSQDRENLFGVN